MAGRRCRRFLADMHKSPRTLPRLFQGPKKPYRHCKGVEVCPSIAQTPSPLCLPTVPLAALMLFWETGYDPAMVDLVGFPSVYVGSHLPREPHRSWKSICWCHLNKLFVFAHIVSQHKSCTAEKLATPQTSPRHAKAPACRLFPKVRGTTHQSLHAVHMFLAHGKY